MRLIELKITISQGDFNQINWELVLFADKFIPLHCSYVSAACVPLKYRGTKNTSQCSKYFVLHLTLGHKVETYSLITSAALYNSHVCLDAPTNSRLTITFCLFQAQYALIQKRNILEREKKIKILQTIYKQTFQKM